MKLILVNICLLFSILLHGQLDSLKNWEIQGYVKNMQSIFLLNFPFPNGAKELFQENLIHHRFNFKWYLSENFTFRADLRNRIILGDLIELDPNYISSLDLANDIFDLSQGYRQDYGLALHTMLDRLYLEYTKGDWEASVGRQRINWGISSFWNPNDLFNSFSFVDFDHEERPGSDAIRVRKYFGFASHLELAAKMSVEENKRTVALLYAFNANSYDFQVLAGWTEEQLVFGAGWAGSIKDVGFKGEFSAFAPLKNEDEWTVNATIGIEHVFKNNMMLASGILFVSEGTTNQSSLAIFDANVSPKQLYPYKYSLYNSLNYSFHPLWQSSITFIYSPSDVHALFLYPTVSYSLGQNWDLDVIGQFAFEKQNAYQSPIQAFFIRIKWSY
jgi:hypothetical protein